MLKIIISIFLLISSSTWADNKKIIIAAEDAWAPFANPDGTGMAHEVIIAAFATQNIDVEFHVFPYARVLHYLDSGAYVAGFNVPIDKLTEQKYLLGSTPLYEAYSGYYHNTNKPLAITTREDFTGESVGVVRGFGYGQHHIDLIADKYIYAVPTSSDEANIKRLILGRLDSALIFLKVANLLKRQHKLPDEIELAFINEGTDIYLAFSKSHPQSKHYQAIFENGLFTIITNGERERILSSY